MLREISGVRQDDPQAHKRWYQDDYFDLFVWTEAQGQLRSFQLAYARGRHEKVLSWEREGGFTHRLVDDGETSPFDQMTPLLSADAGPFPKAHVLSEFDARAVALEPQIRQQVRARLEAYRPRRSRRGARR